MDYPAWQQAIREAQTKQQAENDKRSQEGEAKKMAIRAENGRNLMTVLGVMGIDAALDVDVAVAGEFKFRLLQAPYSYNGEADFSAKEVDGIITDIHFHLLISRNHFDYMEMMNEDLYSRNGLWSIADHLQHWQAEIADIIDRLEASYQIQMNRWNTARSTPAPTASKPITVAEQLEALVRQIADEIIVARLENNE